MLQRILYILLIFFSLNIYSQDVKVIRDFKLRTGVTVEKEFDNNLGLFVAGALEYQKDVSSLGKYFVEGGLSYLPWKFLKSEIDFRHSYNRKYFSEDFKPSNRIGIHLEGRKRFDRTKLYYRIRYQNIDDDLAFYEAEEPGKNVIKNRFKLRYSIPNSRITPMISTELYSLVGQTFEFTRLKTIIGGKYSITNWTDVSVYYKIERELNVTEPYLLSTLGVNFTFKL